MPRSESYREQKACMNCKYVFKRFELESEHEVKLEFRCTWVDSILEKWPRVRSFGVCERWEGSAKYEEQAKQKMEGKE